MSIASRFLQNRQASTGTRRPLSDIEGFDYVISSRADLVNVVEPVGGVFTLPDGSYAFKDNVVLNGERISIDGNVYLQGMTPGDGLSSVVASPLVTITSGARLDIVGMTLVNTDSALTSEGDLRVQRSHLESVGDAIAAVVTGGTAVGVTNNYETGLNYAINITGGRWQESLSNILTAENGVNVGATSEFFSLIDSRVICGNTGMRLRGGRVELKGCVIASGADGQASVAILGVEDLLIEGGRLTTDIAGAGRSGLAYQGNNTSTRLVGVLIDTVNTGVLYTSGTVGSVLINGMTVADSVDTGIQWPNGSAPVSGLSVNSTALLVATPLNGFDATAARMQLRQVFGPLGPLTESALVP